MENRKLHQHIVPAGTVVITGPQGCGKTRNGKALARHYGKCRIVDNWMPGTRIPSDAIALTCETNLINAIPFKNAMRAAGLVKTGAA
jgi:hypothetical protein